MQSGYWIHNAPVGYRYEKVKGRGRMLFPNPPFDGIIREAYEGYASGRFATHAEVKRFFESFPDFPRYKYGGITNQRVADILSLPVYTGYICSEIYGISWLKGQHEPLISLETFEKAQKRREGAAYALSLIGYLGQARFPCLFRVFVTHPGHASLRSLFDAARAPLHAYVGSDVESLA